MAAILATGSYAPQQVVSNKDLSEYMDTSDQWITERSGIKERHWARRGFDAVGEIGNFGMVERASSIALQRAGLSADDIDGVVYATISADTELPGSGALLQKALFGSRTIPVFEVRNHCTGFLYALSIASAYVNSGEWRYALVIGAEICSSGLNLSTAGRNTAVLFGDGAGVVVLGASKDAFHGVLKIKLASDGSFADKLGVVAPSFSRAVPISEADFEGEDAAAYPHMDGKLVFKMASLKMAEVLRQVVSETGCQLSDLALIVPHQANQRIIDMLEKELGLQGKVYSNISRYGNTTAASIPIALNEALEIGMIRSGDLISLCAFGAGFSWGATVIRL